MSKASKTEVKVTQMNQRRKGANAALSRLNEAQARLDELSLRAQTHVPGVPVVVEKADPKAIELWQLALTHRDKAFRASQMISYLAHRG